MLIFFKIKISLSWIIIGPAHENIFSIAASCTQLCPISIIKYLKQLVNNLLLCFSIAVWLLPQGWNFSWITAQFLCSLLSCLGWLLYSLFQKLLAVLLVDSRFYTCQVLPILPRYFSSRSVLDLFHLVWFPILIYPNFRSDTQYMVEKAHMVVYI